MLKEGSWIFEGSSDEMWNTMEDSIRKISQEVLGESKGRGPSLKETWWWNNVVQAVLKTRKRKF